MQREELSQLIDNLVKQVIYEMELKESSTLSETKALVVVPQTVFSLYKYEQYFLDTYKNAEFTFASFFDSELYKQKNESIDYVYLGEQGQIEISNRIDEFDKLFIIVNDIKSIDSILSDACDSFVRELIGYYNMQEKSLSLTTSFKNSLKMNTAIKSRLVKLKSKNIDIINICKDEKNADYDAGLLTEKKVITEKEINEAYSAGVDVIEIKKQQLVTPLAKDKARNYGIKIAY